MRHLSTKAILSAAIGGLFLSSAASAAVVWTGGASGAWNDSTQWTPADVPDTNVEDAVINGTDGIGTAPTSINYGNTSLSNLTLTIRGLSVASPDTITYQSGGSQNTTTRLYVTETMANAGTITIRPSGKSNDGAGALILQGTGNTFNTGTITAQSGGGGHGRTSTLSVVPGNTNAGNIVLATSTGGDSGGNSAVLSIPGSGTFTNNGTIQLDSTAATFVGNSASLILSIGAGSESVTLGGNGSVELMGRPSLNFKSIIGLSRDTGSTGTGTFTNGAGHTIFGAGEIGRNALLLFNDGLIKATGANEQLILDPLGTTASPSAVKFTNNASGRLVSSSAAGLVLNEGVFQNDGRMEARAGAQIIINSNAILTNNGEIRGGGTYVATTLGLTGAAALLPGDSVNADGTGASTVGALGVTGAMALTNATAIDLQMGTPGLAGAGTAYDTVNLSGALTLDGVLNVTDLPGFGPGTYRLFTFAGGGLTDNGLALGSMPGGYTYNIIADNAGGFVNLQVVPEPTSLGLLGLVGFAGLARRRR